jgi:hypothetical protein
MKFYTVLATVFVFALLLNPLAMQAHAASSSAGAVTRQIPSGGTTSFRSGPDGVDELGWPEFAGEDNETGPTPYNGSIVTAACPTAQGRACP